MSTQVIAAKLNISPDKINESIQDWTRLMKNGVLVELNVGRWRGEITLSPADLGLAPGTVDAELIKLGTRVIMPPAIKKELASIEQSARSVLKRAAVEFPHWRGAFVFAEGYDALRDKLDEYGRRYLELGDEFAGDPDRFETYIDRLLDLYEAEASKAYRIAALRGVAVSEEEWVATYMDAIKARIPSAAKIADSFEWRVKLTYIPLPAMLAEEQAQAQTIYQNAALSRMQRDAYQDVATRAKAEATDFMSGILAKLRQDTLQVMEQALATTRKHGSLHARSVVALRNWIDLIDSFAATGDKEIDAMRDRVASLVNSTPAERTVDMTIETLSSITEIVKADLIGLGVREIDGEALDMPDDASIARAAATLDLNRLGQLEIDL